MIFTKLFEVQDYRLRTTNRHFVLEECRNCSHVTLTPKPEQNELAAYYPPPFYSTGTKSNIITKMNHIMALRRLGKVAKNKRLLDVGCGNGAFLTTAATFGYEVFGQEISEEAIRLAEERLGKNVYAGDLHACNFQESFFDVITLLHVAEHVYDLNGCLAEIRRILKPRGTLLIEVPNFDCIERKIFQRYCLYIDAPRHLRHFKKAPFGQILRRNAFECKINNGLSFLSFPLGMFHSSKILIRAKFGQRTADALYAITFLPALILGIFIYFLACVLHRKNVIGAICVKMPNGE